MFPASTPTSGRPGGLYADGAPVGAATAQVGPLPGGPFGGMPVDPYDPLSGGAGGVPGVPGGPGDGVPQPPRPQPSGSVVKRVTDAATRIQQFEGPRGYSVRASVIAKHVGWMLMIVLCFAITRWAFAANATWRFGGHVLLYSVAFMLATAAVGSILYADSREQIYEQARHFAFGLVLLPSTALSLFMRLVNQALDTPAADGDMFASILRGNGLPLVYFATVTLPPFVLAKYIFGGIRNINRQAMADEEQLAAMMRQDGYQR